VEGRVSLAHAPRPRLPEPSRQAVRRLAAVRRAEAETLAEGEGRLALGGAVPSHAVPARSFSFEDEGRAFSRQVHRAVGQGTDAERQTQSPRRQEIEAGQEARGRFRDGLGPG